MTLSAAPAARNLKPLSWEAVNPGALNVKAMTCKSRCLFSRIGAVEIPPHPEDQAVVRAVPVVPAPTAIRVIKQERSAISVQLEKSKYKITRQGLHA